MDSAWVQERCEQIPDIRRGTASARADALIEVGLVQGHSAVKTGDRLGLSSGFFLELLNRGLPRFRRLTRLG